MKKLKNKKMKQKKTTQIRVTQKEVKKHTHLTDIPTIEQQQCHASSQLSWNLEN